MTGRKLRLFVALATLAAGFVLVLLGATSANAAPVAPVNPVGVNAPVAPAVPAQAAATISAKPPVAPIPPIPPKQPSGCPCNSTHASSPPPTIAGSPTPTLPTESVPSPVVTTTTPLSNTGASHVGSLLGTGIGLVALGGLVLIATRRRGGAH
jgi:hypothetical protein